MMSLTSLFLLIASVLQVVAGVVAWRMPSQGRMRVAWRTVAAALFLMASRRLVFLGGELFPSEFDIVYPVEEFSGVVVSVLLLVGVLRMRELWLATDRAREQAERDRQERRLAEEKWQRVFEFAPDGYILLGLDGTLDRMNVAACEIAGLSAAEAEGRPIFELGILSDADIAQAATNLSLLAQGIDPGPAEYTFHRRDGTKRLAEVIGYTLEDRGRTLMLTILHDVTERRRIEEELRKNRARLQEAQKVAGLVTWELNLSTGNLWLSQPPETLPETAEATSRDIIDEQQGPRPPSPHRDPDAADEMKLEDSLAYVHPDDRERVLTAISSVLAPDGPREAIAEYRQTDPFGREGISRTTARVEVDEAGNRVRLTGATLDVTEIRQAEREIRALNTDLEARVRERTAELQSAVAELEAFSYSVSHDLRSPLRAMAGYSQVLIEETAGHLDPASHDHLLRIRAASVRMAGMIDDLLSLARLTRVTRNDAAVDLSALARGVVEELQQAGPARSVEVRIDENLQAWGDAGMLRLVLQNLLANAWKFTRDTARPCIEVGRDADGGYFVRDNGVGFDPAQVAKLFRPFERLHRADEFEGSGIGLATVERIIRHHGGKVSAHGEIGKGSTFTFTLQSRALPTDAGESVIAASS